MKVNLWFVVLVIPRLWIWQIGEKAFFIPTPGQYEQEYLAKNSNQKLWLQVANKRNSKLPKLEKIHFYKGFKDFSVEVNWSELFKIFTY